MGTFTRKIKRLAIKTTICGYLLHGRSTTNRNVKCRKTELQILTPIMFRPTPQNWYYRHITTTGAGHIRHQGK